MKQSEFKPCALCKQGVMHSGSPLFYRLSVENLIVDMRAVQRRQGLEMMMGSAMLAGIMGPNEDLAKPLTKVELIVCQECALKPIEIAHLMELQENLNAD